MNPARTAKIERLRSQSKTCHPRKQQPDLHAQRRTLDPIHVVDHRNPVEIAHQLDPRRPLQHRLVPKKEVRNATTLIDHNVRHRRSSVRANSVRLNLAMDRDAMNADRILVLRIVRLHSVPLINNATTKSMS